MKQHLTELLTAAAAKVCPQAGVVHIERARDGRHGDFASNLALVAAKRDGRNPRQLAAELVAALPVSALVERVEIAGPGFINFHMTAAAYHGVVGAIRRCGARWGEGDVGAGKRALVEFVSANPTGPLHVGHGRGAAFGDAVARLLAAAGYQVWREYYVNDAGRQMDILALSVWLRYLECCGREICFPPNGYRGEYIRDLAADLFAAQADSYAADAATDTLTAALPDEPEARLDELVSRAKTHLGEARWDVVFGRARDAMVALISADLDAFGVHFDGWFSERSLLAGGGVKRALAALTARGHLFDADRAKWFRATTFGDEKDRVVLRADGSHTYFASDIAYHWDKHERGFDLILDVFGADHHGYARRIGASCEALGYPRGRLQVRLVQFAALYRDGVKVPMSTRGGEFVPLRELVDEVGVDAARFFYVSRKNDQHMDFDLDLAKAQSADNPVYYVQYAHARICSVLRQSAGETSAETAADSPDYECLVEPAEAALMRTLSRYPEVVAHAAAELEPHQIAYYLREVAGDFHGYYNAHPFLADDPALRDARLGLIDATRQVLANGLQLLGVSAPRRM